MQKDKFSISGLRIAGIAMLLVLLVCIRFFETSLFYDPFLEFFKRQGQQWPEYQSVKLFLGLLFRYGLNTLLSLGILWLAFKDKGILKLSVILYLGCFIVFIVVLFIILQFLTPNELVVFYLRRFLIQPYLLLLFLPAFYYQKHVK